MTDHAPFIVNLNEDRPHVAHAYPSPEECNADSFDKRVYLDRIEVDELVDSGKAEWCERCDPRHDG
jgi:hypothetical protein